MSSEPLRRPAPNDQVEPLSESDEALYRRIVFPAAAFVDAAEWSEWTRVVRALFVMLDAAADRETALREALEAIARPSPLGVNQALNTAVNMRETARSALAATRVPA